MAVAGLLFSLAFTATASSQAEVEGLTCSPTSVSPGGTVSVSGGGFPAEVDVVVTATGPATVSTTTTTDALGNFSATLTLTVSGTYSVSATLVEPADGYPGVLSCAAPGVTVLTQAVTPAAQKFTG